MVMRSVRPFRAKHGFSLLELLLVLGITGAFGITLMLGRSAGIPAPELAPTGQNCQAVRLGGQRLLQQRQWHLVTTQEQAYVPCQLS